jgi:hypothetical protein
MESKISRSRTARPGLLIGLAGAVALLAAACTGGGPTPETIYVTLPPETPGASSTAEVSPEASGSAEASTSASASAGLVAPTVSSTTITQTAPDGRWTVTFEKPIVGGVPTGAAMSNSVATKVTAYITSFTSAAPAVTPPDGPSTLEGNFSVAHVSPQLLSLRFSVTIYITGAAHPVTYVGSVNFDVLTGTVIQLPDIFTSTAAALPVLTTQAHNALIAVLGADLFWPATITMADFGKAWVFTTAGLEIGWDQGEMGPMAAGPVSVVAPWPALASVIANPGPAAGFLAGP